MKNSTTNWAVLRVRSRALANFLVPCFHQVLLDSNSETLRCVLKADLYLASFDSSCWSAQVLIAFNGLQSSAMLTENAESHTGSHARVHLRFAFQTLKGSMEAGKLNFHVLAQ